MNVFQDGQPRNAVQQLSVEDFLRYVKRLSSKPKMHSTAFISGEHTGQPITSTYLIGGQRSLTALFGLAYLASETFVDVPG